MRPRQSNFMLGCPKRVVSSVAAFSAHEVIVVAKRYHSQVQMDVEPAQADSFIEINKTSNLRQRVELDTAPELDLGMANSDGYSVVTARGDLAPVDIDIHSEVLEQKEILDEPYFGSVDETANDYKGESLIQTRRDWDVKIAAVKKDVHDAIHKNRQKRGDDRLLDRLCRDDFGHLIFFGLKKHVTKDDSVHLMKWFDMLVHEFKEGQQSLGGPQGYSDAGFGFLRRLYNSFFASTNSQKDRLIALMEGLVVGVSVHGLTSFDQQLLRNLVESIEEISQKVFDNAIITYDWRRNIAHVRPPFDWHRFDKKVRGRVKRRDGSSPKDCADEFIKLIKFGLEKQVAQGHDEHGRSYNLVSKADKEKLMAWFHQLRLKFNLDEQLSLFGVKHLIDDFQKFFSDAHIFVRSRLLRLRIKFQRRVRRRFDQFIDRAAPTRSKPENEFDTFAYSVYSLIEQKLELMEAEANRDHFKRLLGSSSVPATSGSTDDSTIQEELRQLAPAETVDYTFGSLAKLLRFIWDNRNEPSVLKHHLKEILDSCRMLGNGWLGKHFGLMGKIHYVETDRDHVVFSEPEPSHGTTPGMPESQISPPNKWTVIDDGELEPGKKQWTLSWGPEGIVGSKTLLYLEYSYEMRKLDATLPDALAQRWRKFITMNTK